MSAYWSFFRIRMKMLAQYRAATWAAMSTQVFWGIVISMTYRAFYAGAGENEPLALNQAVTFLWIGQALLHMMPWNLDKEIEASIRGGHVAYELIRPIHLYGLWWVRALAQRMIPMLLRAAPIFIVGSLFFGLQAPSSFDALLCFVGAVIGALALSTSITSLVMISLFWTVSGEGIQRLLPHTTLLLSGLLIPLPLFPSAMQPFLNWQPFRGVMDIPCRLYTGVIAASEALQYFLFQWGWAGVFVGVGLYCMRRAVRRLTIQGG